jgi:PAS domain S-box-containing protein
MERKGGARGFKIVFVSDRFRAMTGHSEEDLIGKYHGFLHIDPTELDRMRAWARKLSSPAPYTGEGDLVGKDGHAIHAAWSLSRISGGKDSPGHLVAIYRDMTGKDRLQKAQMLSQRFDAVERMAGGVAHDFNNLVSVINGYSQMLATRLAGQPEELRQLEEIQKAGTKAAGLTRRLLALGRRQSFALSLMDLNQFIRDNAGILSSVIGEAGKLELRLAPGVFPVKADPDQMQQVLLSLIHNARDALRDKGQVVVSSAVRDHKFQPGSDDGIPSGRYVVLAVSDNGMGMDSDTMAHIFEPFFTTKSPDKGSGLGLALVYGIVQQSGGFIRVNSTLLLGSTFEVLFPLASSATEPVLRLSPMAQVPSSRGHETILLVEPDLIVTKMLSGMLAAEGYRVLEATNSSDAESVIKKERDPVHLLIISMGDNMECMKLLPLLRARNSGLKVLCTAYCGHECHVDKVSGECQLYMPKPFAISEILKAVRRLLDRRCEPSLHSS